MKAMIKSKITKTLNFNLKLIVLSSLLLSQLSMSEIFLYQNNNYESLNIAKADSSWVVGIGGDAWSDNVTMTDTTEDMGGHDIKLGMMADNFNDGVKRWDGSGTVINGEFMQIEDYGTAIYNVGSNNFSIIGDMRLTGDDARMYIGEGDWSWSTSTRGGVMELIDRIYFSSGYSVLAEANTPIAKNVACSVRTDLYGPGTGAVWIDGVQYISGQSYTDFGQNAIIAHYGTEAYIDNVRVFNKDRTSGTIASNSKDAEPLSGVGDVWKQLSFTGTIPAATTVNLEINSSSNNVNWDGWVVVQSSATAGTTYDIPQANQKRYCKWRLTLNTTDVSKTPDIQAVTFTPGLPPNTAPTAAPPTSIQATDGTGFVVISTTLDDADDDNTLKLKVEYSIDSGSTWHKPYLTNYITTSPSQSAQPDINNAQVYQIGSANPIRTAEGINTLTFKWDTQNPLNEMGIVNYETQVKIRLTPHDNTDMGISQVSAAAFTLDNTSPVNINISSLASATTQVTVTAQTATDLSTLHATPYLFYETTGNPGASSSQWQASLTFTDNNLSPNTLYTYRVKARDIFGNESAYSPPFSIYTVSSSPSHFIAQTTDTTSNTLSVDRFTNDTINAAGYLFTNTTDSHSSGWIQTNSWQDTNLTCGTSYTYTVKYRNAEGIETQTASFIQSTQSCPVGFLPSKPNIDKLKITINPDGSLSFANLTASVSQFSVSVTSDFKNVSWESLDKKDNILKEYANINKLYFKFRTKNGGVSDVLIYKRNSNNISNSTLQDGDIVKTINNPDVYIIKIKNNKQYKRLILSPSVFNSYGHLKWTNIKIASQTELDSFVTSNLVKEATDIIIYALYPNDDRGERKKLNAIIPYDIDSVYEINKTDRDSYTLVE